MTPAPRQFSRFAIIAIVVVVLGFDVIIHAVSMDRGPYMDEGNFLSVGMWINDGDVYYRDMINERGPLAYFVTAGWIALTEPTVASMRLLTTVLSMLQILLLFALGSRWLGSGWALLACVFYLVWHPLALGTIFRSEQLDGFLIVASVLALDIGLDDRRRWLYVAGFLLGALALDKQTSGLFFLFGLGLIATYVPVRERLGALASYVASAAVPWIAVVGYYVAVSDLSTFVVGILSPFGAHYVTAYAKVPGSEALAVFTPSVLAIVAYLALGCGERKTRCIFTAWVVGSTAMVVPSFFVYHALILMLPASIAGAGFCKEAIASRRYVQFGVALLVLIVVGLIGMEITWTRGEFSRDSARWEDLNEVAGEIRARTSADQRIWVFPHESNVYHLAGRKSASRHQFILPWIADREAVAEVVGDLDRNKPEFVVYSNRFLDTSPGVRPIEYVRPVCMYLLDHYVLDRMTANELVLLRRLAPGEVQTPAQRSTLTRLLADADVGNGDASPTDRAGGEM